MVETLGQPYSRNSQKSELRVCKSFVLQQIFVHLNSRVEHIHETAFSGQYV